MQHSRWGLKRVEWNFHFETSENYSKWINSIGIFQFLSFTFNKTHSLIPLNILLTGSQQLRPSVTVTYSSDDYFITEASVFQKEGIILSREHIPPSRKSSKSLNSHYRDSLQKSFAHWPEAASAVHVWALALSIRNRASESENDDLILVADQLETRFH